MRTLVLPILLLAGALPAHAEEAAPPPPRLDAFGDELPSWMTARFGTQRWMSYDDMLTVAYSADGKWVATGGKDGIVWVWDTATGEVVARDGDYDYQVSTLDFAPEGALLAVGSMGGRLKLLDVAERKLLHDISAHRHSDTEQAAVDELEFSPDGSRVATASDEGCVRIWEVESGQEVQVLDTRTPEDGAGEGLWALAWHPGGKLIATGSSQGMVKTWNVETGAVAGRSWELAAGVTSVEFSPDGTLVAAAGDEQIVLWNGETGEQLHDLNAKESVRALRFTPDGKRLVSLGREELRLWKVSTGKLDKRLSRTGHGLGLDVSPDGKTAAVARTNIPLRLVDLTNGRVQQGDTRHRARVFVADASSDGSVVASVSEEAIFYWDAATMQPRRRVHPANGYGDVGHFALSPDGTRAAAIVAPAAVVLWDAESGDLITSGRDVTTLTRVAFSPDSSTLAVVGKVKRGFDKGYAVRLHDAQTGKEQKLIQQGERKHQQSQFIGTTRLLSWKSNELAIWDLDAGEVEHAWNVEGQFVTDAGASSDGKRVAALVHHDATDEHEAHAVLHVWELPENKELLTERVAVNWSGDLALSPDGSLVAVGEDSGLLRAWSVDTGAEHPPTRPHLRKVLDLDFLADGVHLLSASQDTSVAITRVLPLEETPAPEDPPAPADPRAPAEER